MADDRRAQEQADAAFMREALHAARFARGRTAPNPMVGAVVVREGRIVATGWHRRAGEPHAEIHALKMAGPLAEGATLYVTLEPCAHYGRTPPCAVAVAKSGVRRVVVAMVDPNPKVAGRGIAILREAGLEVREGVLAEEARALNEVFLKWILEKRPFVTMKMAMSLDGRIATSTGESRWITGEAARRRVHEMRDAHAAILVGIGTVLADDPALTTRLPGGENPVRVVLDSRARTPLSARLLTDGAAETIIAVTERAEAARVAALEAAGARVVRMGAGAQVDLAALLAFLGGEARSSLLVEGGAAVNDAFLRAGLVDKVCAFLAPMLLGGKGPAAVGGQGAARLSDAVRLKDVRTELVGADLLVTGYAGGA